MTHGAGWAGTNSWSCVQSGQLGHMSCETHHNGTSGTFRSVLTLAQFVLVCSCSRSAQLWSVYITCSSSTFFLFLLCRLFSIAIHNVWWLVIFLYPSKQISHYIPSHFTDSNLPHHSAVQSLFLCRHAVQQFSLFPHLRSACLLFSHVAVWVRIHDYWQVMATIAVFEVMETKVSIIIYHWVGAGTSYFLSSQTWWLRHLCHCTVTPERTSDFSEPAQSQWCQGEPMSCRTIIFPFCCGYWSFALCSQLMSKWISQQMKSLKSVGGSFE